MIGSNDEKRPVPPNVERADLQSGDPYAVLGVAREASLREIKKGYFALVRVYPPETEPEVFKLVRAAYEKLRTAGSKSETDLFLFRPPTPLQPRKRRKKLKLSIDPQDAIRHLEANSDLAENDFSADFRPIKL